MGDTRMSERQDPQVHLLELASQLLVWVIAIELPSLVLWCQHFFYLCSIPPLLYLHLFFRV